MFVLFYMFENQAGKLFVVKVGNTVAVIVVEMLVRAGIGIEIHFVIECENFFRQFGGSCVINYAVVRQSLFADCISLAKPCVKRLIGYKI